jgi:hypothetical protein
MKPETGVRVGDVHLHAYYGHPPDEYGVQWGLTQLDGWFDGWEGSGGVDQRAQADGAWVSPQYARPRVIHVAGRFEAPSWDAATQAWDRLLGQIPFRQLGTLRVSTGEGTLPEQTALVRQHEKPILTRKDNRATFSLSLLAPDARKYDSTSRSASLVLPVLTGGIAPPLTPPLTITGSTSRSQVTLTNDGNWTTYPTFVLIGPCPPATIVNLTTGDVRRVLDTVPAGQSLVIDELNGTATVQGQARRVLGTPIGLQPGVNEVAFYADGYDAGAQLLISYRSAWK